MRNSENQNLELDPPTAAEIVKTVQTRIGFLKSMRPRRVDLEAKQSFAECKAGCIDLDSHNSFCNGGGSTPFARG